MTPAPLFGLLLSLLGVGGLPEIVKIGERIFWSCCSLLDVHKNNIFSKQPGGLFDVSEQAESNQETAFRWVLCGKDHNTEAAKYNPENLESIWGQFVPFYRAALRYAVERINVQGKILNSSRLSAQIEKIPPEDSFHASKRGAQYYSVLSTQYYSQHHDDKVIPDIERQSRLIYVDYFESTCFPIWSISAQFATCWDLELPLSLDLSQEQPPGINSMSFSSIFTWYSFPLLSFFFTFFCFVLSGTTSRY